jgi:hypothetical protein
MIKVEFNKKNENPFFGLTNCLSIFQGHAINDDLLNNAYNEVKDDKTKREMFYSLLFSIGDITNRNHNIFHGKKIDSGGQAKRNDFFTIMNWMIKFDYNQFKKFLFAGLFDEYTCFDNLFRNRVQTLTGTKRVYKIYSMFENEQYCNDLSDYAVTIINGNNPFKKTLLAKFLTLPRLGKRRGHNQMLIATFKLMTAKAHFLKLLSDKIGWDYQYSGNYANFSGYRRWRKQYNSDLESVLFSTGKIVEFDKIQFIDWLNKLPAQARLRVRNRIFHSYKENGKPESGLKWNHLKDWYQDWESFKERAQEEQRVLQEKVRQGIASVEDQIRLQQVKKEAKVTTGATTFNELYQEILSGDPDKLKLESFVENKVNLPFNFLTIIDESGSMQGAPFNFAAFLASVLLYKNPDDTGRNLIGMFANEARFISAIDCKGQDSVNSFWHRQNVVTIAPEPFVIPEKSFYDNYKRISRFLNATFKGGGTYLSAVANRLKEIVSTEPDTLDALKEYPIWCVVSDGDINSSSNAKSSILELQHKCKQYLGFIPYLVIIEITNWNNYDINHFADLDQVMYIPGKIELIEQMLVNFKDIDVFDIYTPLQSIYRSNRYDLIRQNVL